MQDEEYPVDLWVMDVEDDEDFERVKAVTTAEFGERFEWGGPLSGLPRKGVVRALDAHAAEEASRVLEALGASILIHEDAYTHPGIWLSSITPEENRRDALAMVERYLEGGQWPGPGLLTVAFYVTDEGMVRRTMHKWDDLPEFPQPAWSVWDEIV